jgi:uncharacterized protein (DUF2249 family)
MDTPRKPAITPNLKVAELLGAYPELEETLIALAKPFEKLRHPLLRKTVARFTSLEKAAVVAGVPLPELMRTLRKAAGQPVDASDLPTAAAPDPRGENRPVWAQDDNVVVALNADELLTVGHPVGAVLEALGRLEGGQVLSLDSSFIPAPLIDLVSRQGHEVYRSDLGAGQYRTYIRRAAATCAAAPPGGCAGCHETH